MEGCRPNVPFAVHSDSDCAGVFRPALLSMIPRVTDEEILQAFASTVVSADNCADESAASVSASLRNLNIQNNVLFRMIVHSKQFHERSSGMLNVRIICCFVCVTHFSGATSQTFSSLTSSGSSPYSTGDDLLAPGAEQSSGFIPPPPTVYEASQRPRISPPKTFHCFVCGRPFNERDFQRHIEGFVKKANKAMAGVFKTKKGCCPGIWNMSHPILRRFPGDNLGQRVERLCANISSLCHGGALDALSAEGSGRHHDVNARVQFLMSDDSTL